MYSNPLGDIAIALVAPTAILASIEYDHWRRIGHRLLRQSLPKNAMSFFPRDNNTNYIKGQRALSATSEKKGECARVSRLLTSFAEQLFYNNALRFLRSLVKAEGALSTVGGVGSG